MLKNILLEDIRYIHYDSDLDSKVDNIPFLDNVNDNELYDLHSLLYQNRKEGYYQRRLEELIKKINSDGYFDYEGEAFRVLTIDIPALLTGYYGDKHDDIEVKKLKEIVRKYMKSEIKKTKEVKDAFYTLCEILLTEGNKSFPKKHYFDSWAKDLEGIKFFKENMFGNFNVIAKTYIKNGFDYQLYAYYYYKKYLKNCPYNNTCANLNDTIKVKEVMGEYDEVEIHSFRVLQKKKTPKKASKYSLISQL